MISSARNRGLLTVSLLTAVLAGSAPTQSESSPDFLLRASDVMTTLQPTAGPNNLANCLLVLPDGRFYLSLKRQEIMDGTATVKGFQGLLDAEALQWLRGFLNRGDIRNLPQFEVPNRGGTDAFWVFEGQIAYGSAVRRVGYYQWTGRANYSDAVRKQWQESQAKLQPLVDWFRALKTSKYPLKRPASKSTLDVCN